MRCESLRTNPDRSRTAPPPRIERLAVNGTTLYCEIRGTGPAVLLVHGGGEDAEVWRPVAERLSQFTVVTYDRRGTLRSGREDWPGRGSAQHADDAAAILETLGLAGVVVFGASSGGIPALQLALRHPTLVRRALIYEPGYFRHVDGGDDFQLPVNTAVADHLAAHPSDWMGAYAAFRRAASPSGALVAPSGKSWYEEREELDAEAFVRDDVPILTRERFDENSLAVAPVEVRFACGSRSPRIFREIATHLAAVRGERPDVVEDAGHLVYHWPDAAAAYIGRWV